MAALALGFLVLSKAFPSGDGAPAGTPGGQPGTETSPAISPPVSPSPTREVLEPLDPSEISLQVLNGTEVSGLAADTAELLEQAGYDVVTIGDAEASYDMTTLFYKRKRKVDAQLLQQAYFPSAKLEVAGEDTKVDITINLGTDYAESLEAGGAEGTPEETPT